MSLCLSWGGLWAGNGLGLPIPAARRAIFRPARHGRPSRERLPRKRRTAARQSAVLYRYVAARAAGRSAELRSSGRAGDETGQEFARVGGAETRQSLVNGKTSFPGVSERSLALVSSCLPCETRVVGSIPSCLIGVAQPQGKSRGSTLCPRPWRGNSGSRQLCTHPPPRPRLALPVLCPTLACFCEACPLYHRYHASAAPTRGIEQPWLLTGIFFRTRETSSALHSIPVRCPDSYVASSLPTMPSPSMTWSLAVPLPTTAPLPSPPRSASPPRKSCSILTN